MDFPQRRKKVATYGKASRATNYKLFNDAPSPEKPRVPKPSWAGNKGNSTSGKHVTSAGPGPAKPKADSFSIFDMPSSDEELSKPPRPKTPVKKARPVAATTSKKLNYKSTSDDSASEQLLNEVAAAEAKRLIRKRSPSNERHAEEPAGKKASRQTTAQRGKDQPKPTKVTVAHARRDAEKDEQSKRPHVEAEIGEQKKKSTYAVVEIPSKTAKKTREASPLKNDHKHAPGDMDAAQVTQKAPAKTALKPGAKMTMGIRTARSQKDGHAAEFQSAAAAAPQSSALSATKAISLTRSRRNQAQGASVKPAIQKGKSAPTLLQSMLPSPETKPSSPAESPASPDSPTSPDDEDEVVGPATPPARTSKSPFGAVTPRQHTAWSKLLDDTETSTPSALNFTELKLNSVKPRKTSLQRSSSDMIHAAGARRQRLIDTLKQDASSDEEEDDDDDDEDETMVDAQKASRANFVKFNKGESPRESPPKSSQRTETNTGFSQEAASSQTSAIPAAGPKLTYARTRSYLDESNLEDELMLGLPMLDSLGPTRRPRPQDDLGEDEDGGSGMRNIHELRAAGTARRVVDDIENLLDDLEDKKANSLSRRRSALLELCSKLTDKNYVGRMVDNGLDHRLFESCAKSADPVLGFLVASAIQFMVLAEAPRTTMAAIHHAGCLKTLSGLLKLDNDINGIAKERRTNLSKVARDMLGEFRTLISETIWPEETPQVISPQLVALKSLETVVRKLRESGNSEDLLGFQAFADVAALAAGPAQSLAAGSAAPSDVNRLELLLSILESGSLNATAWTNSATDSDASMSQLSKSIDAVLNSGSSSTDQLEALSLRLTLNLTNNNPEVCDVFATPSLVQRMLRSIDSRCQALSTQLDEEQHMQTLDRLILTLGAMINLAEFSERARTASLKEGDAVVHSLVRSFLHGMERAAQADSMEESQSSVAYGYLAVLLGNLCQTWAVREKIRAKLPQQRLDVLIRAVEEFIFVHQRVDKEAFDGEEGREVWANYTARLQGVIDRLQGRPT